MFFLNRQAFRGSDTTALVPFVACWERHYRGTVSVSPTDDQPIDYFSELNVAGDLSEQNVSRLLRWKDPRMLTHPKVTSEGSTPNPRVARVLNQLAALNSFRRGEITATQFEETVRGVFASGIVWQLFLFHIARPWEWPIADQHVFRALAALFGIHVPRTITDFGHYRCCFAKLAESLRTQSSGDNLNRDAVTRSNKRLDDALMAYGQFLLSYDR